MNDNLLKQLNPIQKKAVLQTDGPILILAGAGSGKTRVLTYKVAYLIIEKKIPAEQIYMVTFTNKAANEMKERIRKLLISKSINILPFAGTFHSFCAKVLRQDGYKIGIPNRFIIYDEIDQKDAIKELTARLNLDNKKFNPGVIRAMISQAKNELIKPLEYLNIARGYFQENVGKIYIEYQKLLQNNNSFDFDDLILYTVELLNTDLPTQKFYQNKIQYLLIDEYQDTNHAQYVLSNILANKRKNITVVGDASQSIYAFRGADFRNIINFKKDYKNVKIYNLEQNYRSTQNILDTAFNIISKNKSHPILHLWTDNMSGEKIKIYQASSEHNEAEFITNEITLQRLSNKSNFADFAVLYRTNAQSRVIEESFLHASIPYLLVGGVRFYERKEIKDVLAYLRLIVNPKESVSLKRVKKIGIRRFDKFIKFNEKFNRAKIDSIEALELLDKVLEETAYLDIYNQEDEEDMARLENIKELRSVATQFPNLIELLENISLVEQEYYPDHPLDEIAQKNAVTLMTVHAAKGLEFENVFIIGMEEGLFPHSRSLIEPLEIEEERRLCYVGVTRAKKRLYLTYSSKRLYFGDQLRNSVSRFLMDIPENIVDSLTANYFI